MDDLTTYAENTWCPGCGNFGIFTAVKKAIETLGERGVGRDRIVMTAGIGCHGKMHDYLALSGLYSLHGRSMATAQGMKIANPDLKVIAFAGDGDAFGEGIAHMIFAAKRNEDITVVVHENGVYGLTTGQFTPLTPKGFRGPSTPNGSVEEPLNPLVLMLEAGASFVARGYSARPEHLAQILVKAVEHRGFSFVDVLQPCVSFNNTYGLYNSSVVDIGLDGMPFEEALSLARKPDEGIPIGVFYSEIRPSYHQQLYGDKNPYTESMGKDMRREAVRKTIEEMR